MSNEHIQYVIRVMNNEGFSFFADENFNHLSRDTFFISLDDAPFFATHEEASNVARDIMERCNNAVLYSDYNRVTRIEILHIINRNNSIQTDTIL